MVSANAGTVPMGPAPVQETEPEPGCEARHILDAEDQHMRDRHRPGHNNKPERKEETESNLESLFNDSDSGISELTGVMVEYFVPAFAAETIRGAHGGTINAIRDSSACLEIEMTDDRGEDTQEVTMYVIEGDKGPANKVRSIITEMILEHTRGEVSFTTGVITEGLRLKVMEGIRQ